MKGRPIVDRRFDSKKVIWDRTVLGDFTFSNEMKEKSSHRNLMAGVLFFSFKRGWTHNSIQTGRKVSQNGGRE
jgi:hypothetical protein